MENKVERPLTLDGKCLLLKITLVMKIVQTKEESWFMMAAAIGEVTETEK